jgi:hypothetical protein
MPQSVKLPDDSWILYRCPWAAADFSRLRREVVQHILKLR